jgi:hypothetical protein
MYLGLVSHAAQMGTSSPNDVKSYSRLVLVRTTSRNSSQKKPPCSISVSASSSLQLQLLPPSS